MSATEAHSTRVLHFKSILQEDGIPLGDVLGFVQRFGQVCYVVVMPRLRQVLVEMMHIGDAEQIMSLAGGKAVLLHDHAFFLNFSQSQYIHKEVPFKKTNCIHHGERILLMTIHNPIHPITVQVIQAVFRGYKLQKAVIFHTNGVQCLSEFESPEDARSAREALDGREIYAGCCLMKIEYSSMRRPLSVRRNTEFAIDLTGIFEL